MRSKRGDVLHWGMTLSLFVGSSYAQQSPAKRDRDAFGYASPLDCPQRSEFVARVNARQSSRSSSEVDHALNELLSQVLVEPSLQRGMLHFRDARTSPRQVTASTCDEVVTGLALIAGVSLDGPANAPDVAAAEPTAPSGGPALNPRNVNPSATSPNAPNPSADNSLGERATAGDNGSEEKVGATPNGPPGPSRAPVQPLTASSRDNELPVPARSPQPTTSIAPAPPLQSPPATVSLLESEAIAVRRQARSSEVTRDSGFDRFSAPSRANSVSTGLGAAGGVWTAFGRPELRLDGFFELGSDDWAARVGGFATWGDNTALSWGARWAAYGGRVEGCPVVIGRSWHLGVCGLGELGAVKVSSDSSADDGVDDAQLLWADAGLGLRVGSPPKWKVNLEAQLDAVVPFTRYVLRFEEPAATLARVPTGAVMLRLGFRWRPGVE